MVELKSTNAALSQRLEMPLTDRRSAGPRAGLGWVTLRKRWLVLAWAVSAVASVVD